MMIKTFLFLLVLVLASAVDIRLKTVPTSVHIVLFAIGLIEISLYSWIGFFLTFLPLFFTAMIFHGKLGGGDVKLSGMIGFCMGGLHGLFAVIIGLILGIIIQSVITKFKKQSSPFALVPYLSAGCLIFIILNGGL